MEQANRGQEGVAGENQLPMTEGPGDEQPKGLEEERPVNEKAFFQGMLKETLEELRIQIERAEEALQSGAFSEIDLLSPAKMAQRVLLRLQYL